MGAVSSFWDEFESSIDSKGVRKMASCLAVYGRSALTVVLDAENERTIIQLEGSASGIGWIQWKRVLQHAKHRTSGLSGKIFIRSGYSLVLQPSSLDYFEVVFTLCDLLEHVYKKFLAADLNPQTAKTISKLDSRFKVCL